MVSTDDAIVLTSDDSCNPQDAIDSIKEQLSNGSSDANGNGTNHHEHEQNGKESDVCSGFSSSRTSPVNGVKTNSVNEDDKAMISEASTPAPTSESVVECIELDDDDTKEPPAKKAKSEDDDIKVIEDPKENKPVEEKKAEPELNSPEALLNKLEEYISDAIDNKKDVDRKVLDALLGAINVQVQREPLSVRKLILDKQLVLPNTISFPPSRVVDMLIEHDPEYPLSKVINKMFGDERPKLSDTEKKERQVLKAQNPAPHMTKLLMDIGQDLVQEATYCDIVHAKNLPETPKNIETYKTVAAQLKPVWEALKKKNEPYKMKLHTCQICGFKTESRLVLQTHRSRTHYKNGKYQCAMCPEYDTNEQRLVNHYLENHAVVAVKEEPLAKYPCPICEEDFQFKGIREQHLKQCKKDYSKVRQIMAPKPKEDILTINNWLWERPPVDPTILQQQQAAQASQKRQVQAAAHAQVQAQQAAQVLRRGVNSAQAALIQQQLLQQQRAQQQMRQAMLNPRLIQNAANVNGLIAAMQQHMKNASSPAGRNPTAAALAAASQLYQQSQRPMASSQAAAAASKAAVMFAAQQAALKKVGAAATLTPAMQKALSAMSATSTASVPASSTPVVNTSIVCEICDSPSADKERYLAHLQTMHKQMKGKTIADMQQGAPLACSRCRDRFWTYEGLERHLVMSHGLVTADLLQKAQRKEDGGRCKTCGKQYAFNMLQHLVADHAAKLCSAEIMYSCDVCSFKCNSYHELERHLSTEHPKNGERPSTATNEKAAENGKVTVKSN